MDCDFFKQTYYYNQPGPQGEISSHDDLSWLIYPVVIDSPDPKEQVGETTNVVSENIISPLPSNLVPPVEHPELQEVNSDEPLVIENSCNNIVNVDVSNRYELPPKRTMKISHKQQWHSILLFTLVIFQGVLKKLSKIQSRGKQWKKKFLPLIKTKLGEDVTCHRERKQ